MGGVVKSIFGGKDDSAQDLQLEQNREAKDFIERKGTEARQDLLGLFPAADTNRQRGTQAALDVLGASTPQAIEAFQQGNINAQAAILGGQPSINRIPVNTRFLSQQVPDFIPTAQVAPSPQVELSNLLSGMGSDADLLLAASRGQIPNINRNDREWFGKFLADGPQFSNTRNFLDAPGQVINQTLGSEGGLNPTNQQRLAHLLGIVRGA